MLTVKGIFDGQEIKPIEPIPLNAPTEVIILFMDKENDVSLAAKARHKLRASAKGSKLTEKLLESRREDLEREEQ